MRGQGLRAEKVHAVSEKPVHVVGHSIAAPRRAGVGVRVEEVGPGVQDLGPRFSGCRVNKGRWGWQGAGCRVWGLQRGGGGGGFGFGFQFRFWLGLGCTKGAGVVVCERGGSSSSDSSSSSSSHSSSLSSPFIDRRFAVWCVRRVEQDFCLSE